MRNRFDRQLEELNNGLIHMGSLIEQAIEAAVDGLVQQDVEKAKQAMEFEEEINHAEREIEALCLKLLLQQQPVASDLRQISAALKMITDMERIGDHATDISELTMFLAEQPHQINMGHKQICFRPALTSRCCIPCTWTNHFTTLVPCRRSLA